MLTILLSGFTVTSDQNLIGKTSNPGSDTWIHDSAGDSNSNNYLPLLFNFAVSKPPALPYSQRVNIPFFENHVVYSETAIFWFGQVTPTENYADVRIGYNQDKLWVNVTIIDRRLWYDPNPSIEELTQWDAVSLYLDINGNTGNQIDSDVYRFDGQLNWWEPREEYQAVYRGTDTGWEEAPLSFITGSGWRGWPQPNDDLDDEGWVIVYEIPFQSLGLSETPPQDTVWGIALSVHDRDDSAGTPILDKIWPPGMESNKPSTWGQLRFGLPDYSPPEGAIPDGTVTIRHGLNGASVIDNMVGGSMDCGEGRKWTDWGWKNYQGAEQVNVQNEADVSDWVCFSKYYLTFPLNSMPLGKEIISATLTLTSVGNAGGGEWGSAPDSLVQVMMVAEDWEEAKLNWNNAPLAIENVSRAWVEPVAEGTTIPPGVQRNWDLSYAVNQAYSLGIPLRLALYAADGEYNTGRYFATSETGNAIQELRPTLDIVWGEP